MANRRDPANAADSREVVHSRGQALALSMLVLAACLGATYAVWRQVQSDAVRIRRAAFESRADQIVGHLRAHLERHEQLLRGVAGLAAASERLTRREFRAYVDSLQIGGRFPEIRGIGIAILVDAGQRDRTVGEIRADGVPEYRIHPEGERPAYAPVLYLERSADDGGLGLGYDMYSDPVRHAAMDRAREGAMLSMSGMVPLRHAPGDEGTPGIDFFLPVFDGPAVEGMGEGSNRVTGWTFSQISMDEMVDEVLREALGDSARGLDVRIDDGTGTPGHARLYGLAAGDAHSVAPASVLTSLRHLTFGGQQWGVEVGAGPGFKVGREDVHPILFTTAGAAFSFLLAILTWLLATGRIRARTAAARMNEDLIRSESRLRELNEGLERRVAARTRDLESIAERLTLSVETSNTGLWDWNLLTGEVHYSREWTRQIGLEPKEIAPTIDAWESRLHPADREAAVAALRAHLENPGTPFETEFRLRHEDGSYRTILARSQVYADAFGKPVRVVGSHLDITDRKRAEAALLKLTRELRQVWRQVSTVEEAERRWLASELHDSIGSALTALNLNLTIIREGLPAAAKPSLEPRLDDSLRLLEETVDAVRSLMAQLRPPVLDDYGLATALRWYLDQFAARSDLKAAFKLTGMDARFPADLEIALFRIAQGALTNVAKHAGARHVTVSLDIAPTALRMVVADDGRGFVVEDTHADMGRPHWGLVTMRERAESIGGHCTIESSKDGGTRVVVDLPRAA